MKSRGYRILMVCTGNICRSPVMERLLAARLREQFGPDDADRFVIGSAGTWAMVGDPMAPEAERTLSRLGGDSTDFVARDLTPEMIKDADLVLTATRDHRRLVVMSEPRAVSRTLTIRELARLLGPVAASDIDDRVPSDDPVERMAAIVAAALAQRGLVPMGDPTDDDIADPYGRDPGAYLRAAGEIDAALTALMALMAPTPG